MRDNLFSLGAALPELKVIEDRNEQMRKRFLENRGSIVKPRFLHIPRSDRCIP